MPRRARAWLWIDTACYHVINRGHARETAFHDDDDRARFLTLLQRWRARFEPWIHHYCLMGLQFQLLLPLPDARPLSRCILCPTSGLEAPAILDVFLTPS
jgi:hypothetical protein